MALPQIVSLNRYPVKGLSAEPLQVVDLEARTYFPGDRIYAVENGPSGYDPQAPVHMPKIKFLMLMRHARLARLSTRFDPTSEILTIARDGRVLVRADLSDRAGRATVEAFFADFCRDEANGDLRVLPASAPCRFTDSRSGFISIINLASIADLEEKVRQRIDPLRFRANILIEGASAWSERQWLGRSFTFGAARLEPTKLIDRCAATMVDPQSGARDIDVPAALMRHYGHLDLGIYAEVKGPGRVAIGDPVEELA